MSIRLGYIAAALLPLFYTEIPNLAVHRGQLRHKRAVIPADENRRIARERWVAPYAGLVMLGLSVYSLVSWTGVSLVAIGWTAARKSPLLTGVIAGFGWLGICASVSLIFPPSKQRLTENIFGQRSVVYWVPLASGAAVIEEVWRAFCLVSISPQGRLPAILVTAGATGWAHLHPASRAVWTALAAVYMAELFFRTGSLWATVPAHLLVDIGLVLLIRSRRPR